jgi:hypothetical protein
MLPSQLGPALHLQHPFLPSSDLQNRARLTATSDNPGWVRSQPLEVGQKSSAADIEHRGASYRPRLRLVLERYVCCDLAFHVHVGIRPVRNLNIGSGEYCVRFEWGGKCLDAPDAPHVCADNPITRLDLLKGGEVKRAVLVDVRKFLKWEQGARRGVLPSVVRLQAINGCSWLARDGANLVAARCRATASRSWTPLWRYPNGT